MRPLEMIATGGIPHHTIKELSALAGLNHRIRIEVWEGTGLCVSPHGDFRATHYFSLLMKFGEAEKPNAT